MSASAEPLWNRRGPPAGRAAVLRQRLDLVGALVEKDLLLRYQGTALGLLWSLASPLALAGVLHLAFVVVFKVPIARYDVFILSALFPWQWLANSVQAAPTLFFANGLLVKKSRASRGCLCVSLVVGDMLHFAMTLPVFALLSLVRGGDPPGLAWLLGIPLLLLLQAALALALVLVVSAANVFVRDLDQLVRVALTLLFYSTPVLFPVALFPERFGWWLWLNPLAPLIISWRALLLENALSPYLGLAALHALLGLGAALAFFRRANLRLPELL